ncbi:MAG: STAS domain-containing protein [Calditrichaeota bacterium]|nr:STAS domain-containing protein [Calditrichota bacterium]
MGEVTTVERDVVVLHPHGELDVHTCNPLREDIERYIQSGQAQLVVDLSDVTYLDSSALGVLVTGLKLARKSGGALKLSGLQSNVRKIFDLTRLSKFFEIYDDPDSAASSFPRG